MQRLTKSNLYIIITCFLGIVAFLFHIDFSFNLIGFEWTNVVFLVISIILLNHFMILLPPKGNAISMDSAVYLATTFIFGLEITLIVLLIGSLIFALYQHNILWWKHLLNFSVSSIMIISAYYTFILLGGQIGFLHMETSYVYVGTLIVYYAINIIFIRLYFHLGSSENVIAFLKNGISTEILFSYLSTLVMTVILGVLIISHGLFGLLLFTSIVALLSMAFKHYYNLYEEVAKKANTDSLTSLYNHSYFKEVLADLLKNRKGLKLSFALIDVDDFKKYNDSYGHLAGDDLLRSIGSLLKESCKEQGFFVARYGGEEFVIIMENVEKKAAIDFLNTLRKRVNDSFYQGAEIFPHGCLSFSGGVVEYDEGVYNSAELIGKADQAMYFAKAQGKNNVQLFDNITISSTLLDHEKEIELLEQQIKFFLYKDVYTYKHSRRVYQYARDLTYHLQLSDYQKKVLISGALIHDIGKIEIPRDIINKKGKLEPFEWEIIKKHVTWGKEIIATNKDLHDLIPLVELHHERYDGKGYPYGLKGKSIPKLARILCVIDSFDAMTTERPYQATKTFDEAVNELELCAGTQFDPQYIPPFIEMIKELYPAEFETKAVTDK